MESSVTRSRNSHRKRVVLHLLPTDVARGAQVAARGMRMALDRPAEEHRILTFFDSESVALNADYGLQVPMEPFRSLGFDPRVALRLRRALSRIQPAVVIAHGGEPLKYAAPLLTSKSPLVYFALGTMTPSALRGARRALYKSLLRRCRAIAGISAECIDELVRVFDADPDRVSLIPNSRDPLLFCPPEVSTWPSGSAALLFVGHMTTTKRPDWFLDVVLELRRRGCTITASLVGDGPLEGMVRRRAENEGVQFLGRRLDVADVLRRADIFLFTSEPESEGMPGVLIEAGMTALPVVATRTPGVPTVVADGVTGFVVDHDDFGGFVDRVEKLARDHALRDAMGSAARDRCMRLFSNDSVHAQWRELIASVSTS